MADMPEKDKSESSNPEASANVSTPVSAPAERRPPPRRSGPPQGGGQGGGYRRNNYQSGGGGGDDGGRGGPGGPGGRRGGFFQGRRKVCPIKLEEINWKNIDALRYFVNENGNIRSRRKTGATAKIQRRAAAAVKQARHMALLPYTGEHVRIQGGGRR